MKMASSEFDPMDEEEREIMEAIERGDTQPVPIEELERIRAEIRGSAHNITIRMKDADIVGMKAKAARLGTSYQTLINSIVHRYLTGGITINEAF
jgi:predicted DNA binding CopG/RHH family protein